MNRNQIPHSKYCQGDTISWLRLAASDLCSAAILTNDRSYFILFTSIGYLIHQSLEKLLKGYLSAHDIHRRGHDLPDLLNAAKQYLPELGEDRYAKWFSELDRRFGLRYPTGKGMLLEDSKRAPAGSSTLVAFPQPDLDCAKHLFSLILAEFEPSELLTQTLSAYGWNLPNS
jgi:HEPN domain-containing protein